MKAGSHDDPKIHAYIDNELDVEDRAELLEAMHTDAGLRDQVCELRRIKDLVQQAYIVPPPPVFQPRTRKHGPLRTLIARCAVIVLMLLSFAGGWLIHSRKDEPLLEHLAALGAVHLQNAAGSHSLPPPRVLLHVATDNPVKFAGTLRQASYLLKTGRKEGIEVEVVANAGGLKLLEANGNSNFANRIRNMMREHPNLHFVACGITVHNLEAAGVPVDLIRHVSVAPSAVEEVVKRLREGWMYVNIRSIQSYAAVFQGEITAQTESLAPINSLKASLWVQCAYATWPLIIPASSSRRKSESIVCIPTNAPLCITVSNCPTLPSRTRLDTAEVLTSISVAAIRP